jgi:SAM-dependent methyltransferase
MRSLEETTMTSGTDTTDDRLRDLVSERYGELARAVTDDSSTDTCCGTRDDNPITRDLYSSGETAELPTAAAQASLGCGNPTALIDLHEGEVVLDLGSGGGIDVLLSARRVGPSGKAYGLDMTDEMLDLARRNQREAGVDNVEFLKGYLEDIPLPDNSVDVVISNCVINLSPDKGQALQEAFRVLRPGGRFAVSDVVVRGPLDPLVRSNVEAWIGCVAGALDQDDYIALLGDAGFIDVDVEPTREYHLDDASDFIAENGIDPDEIAEADGHIVSAFVRATKPAVD